MSTKKVQNDRLYHLDLIRFIAALYVVLYHYGFRGFAKDNLSILQFQPLEGFSKYGYLGVDLFFIISGFVILMSVKNSNLIDFCISRFTRLYPAFWLSVILSASIIALYGDKIFNVTFSQILFNLTMFNGFFGIEHVDGVYWSLVVELKFYILIAIILFFKKLKFIKVLGYILLAISLMQLVFPFAEVSRPIQAVYYLTFARWSAYFVAGMFFYLMKSEGNIISNIVPVLIAYLISIRYAVEDVVLRNDRYNNVYSDKIVVLLITIFFLILLLISIGQLKFLNKKIFLYFGVLTYPLYLIHQNIGFIIFNHLGNESNKWFLLFSVMVLMLVVSFLINKYLEKPLGSYLRKKLSKNKFLLSLKSKLASL